MGLVDIVCAEDRIDVKFSDFYNLVKGCTQQEVLMNGIKCDIPHKYLREMMSGKKEDAVAPESEEGDKYCGKLLLLKYFV